MNTNWSHPNFRLWCILAAIPIVVIIAVYIYILAR